jgi:transposase
LRRQHLSAISGITPDGRLFVQVQEQAYTAAKVVGFLKHLLAHIPGRVLVLWDGNNIHRGPVVEAFLATEQGQRVTTDIFPGYAPELNPDEWVWNHLKRVELPNVRCSTLADLRVTLRRAVRRLQRKRHVVAAFVRHVYGEFSQRCRGQ